MYALARAGCFHKVTRCGSRRDSVDLGAFGNDCAMNCAKAKLTWTRRNVHLTTSSVIPFACCTKLLSPPQPPRCIFDREQTASLLFHPAPSWPNSISSPDFAPNL